MNQDLNILLEKSLEILKREITNLMLESASKKLSAASARDLVSYVKLLTDVLKKEQKEEDDLDKLSPTEIKALAKELINE